MRLVAARGGKPLVQLSVGDGQSRFHCVVGKDIPPEPGL
jgi:hypothetical protein